MSLSKTEWNMICPFFIIMNRSGIVESLGDSIKKINSKICAGESFFSHFDLISPVEFDIKQLATLSQPEALLIRPVGGKLSLKGQILPLDSAGEAVIVIVSPFIKEISEALQAGLHFGDFALSDPIFDFMMLIQSERDARTSLMITQNRVEEQNRLLTISNEQLQREVEERNAAEQRLIRAKNDAESANRAKSQFLANMSHEIRTPLNGIIGLTNLVLEGVSNDKLMDFLTKVKRSGDHLLSIVNDILDFSKIEAGELTLEQTVFNLPESISEAVEVFVDLAEQKKLKFSAHLILDDAIELDLLHRGSGLAGIFVSGDPTRLKQILFNLIGNAVKFTQKGGVEVNVQLLPQGSSMGINIAVKDTGIGMTSEQLNKLFQPFMQADSSHSRKFGGTGLGLTISKRLTDLMGGTIDVESTIGVGTRFISKISLPLIKNKAPEAADANSANLISCISTRIKILVAEDNEINQEVIGAILKKLGCLTKIVNNGQEALDALNMESFNIILMDCQMPVMDGFEATHAIRVLESGLGRRTPIVAMTANAMKGDRIRCLNLGMDDYLSKPVRIADVQRVIEEWASDTEASHDKNETVHTRDNNGHNDTEIYDRECLNFLKQLQSMGDLELIENTVFRFVRTYQSSLDGMSTTLNSEDIEGLRKAAHKFKTSCGVVGCISAVELCSLIEGGCHDGFDKGATAKRLKQLQIACDNAAAFLTREFVVSNHKEEKLA